MPHHRLKLTTSLAAEAGKFPLKELFKAGRAGVYADHGFASSQAAALPTLWFEAGASPARAAAVLGRQRCAGGTPGAVLRSLKAAPVTLSLSFGLDSVWPTQLATVPPPRSLLQATCTARTTTATPSCRSPALHPLS